MSRPISRYFHGLLNKNNWVAFIKSFYIYANWGEDYFIRYILAMGAYPKMIVIRTPCGRISFEAKHHEDLFTVTEIFAMECYKTSRKIETFIDFGGNIGVASAYFLTRNNTSRGVIYEPLQNNINRLKINLSTYLERIEIIPKAIWVESSIVNFSIEETGRYCGINLNHEDTFKVEAINVSDALSYCIAKLGKIDILKIDIEGAGVTVLKHIEPSLFESISQIMIEEPLFEDQFLLAQKYTKTIFEPNGLFYYKK